MTVDREQIRRDAEALVAANPGEAAPSFGFDELRFAHACLALLAELEQAEKARDGALYDRETFLTRSDYWKGEAESARARLAAVPALVEALKEISAYEDDCIHQRLAREALAAFESDREPAK